MADYFSEYTSFIGHKGLPSPADTPYETPAFVRSKRSSRATTIGSRSREQSGSPPPLPPDPTDTTDRTRDARYTALDPRRFTPTLQASLVAEILSLRRDLDSKNHLVENLESSLATVKHDNEQLVEQLSASVKDVRVARSQVQQMENGTYEALESISRERNSAQNIANELRLKLDVVQRKVKLQDEDTERTQLIWEREKEAWENERRQLERRIHVAETRLRTFVDGLVVQQDTQSPNPEKDESRFKDSGLGDDSEDEVVHHRNLSTLSYRSSRRDLASTPEPIANGFSLADELEGEYNDLDAEYDPLDDELDYHEAVRRTTDSRQSNVNVETESKAKRVLGLTDETPSSPARSHSRFGSQENIKRQFYEFPAHKRNASEQSVESQRKTEFEARPLSMVPEVPVDVASKERSTSHYVDTGYQPSPPLSPVLESSNLDHAEDVLPAITINEEPAAKPAYIDSSTQTKVLQTASTHNNLQPPALVPSIAIHPPSSRPATPKQYALPPGTKNVATQANLPWSSMDASVQTEEIRIDQRPVKLPPHLLPSYVLQNIPDAAQLRAARESGPGYADIYESRMSSLDGPQEAIGLAISPDNSSRDQKSMPLKAIPLPKPILAPAISMVERPEPKSQGPLNRSAQFGVSSENRTSRLLANIDNSDASDDEAENSRLRRSRFGPSEHPRNVPEDKELSPERRPHTTESLDAAPAPSIASSRDAAHRARKRPPPKLNTYTSVRSRSPSFGSVTSSWSAQSTVPMPPYPIPTRSSSRQLPFSYSEASWSPSIDPFAQSTRPSKRQQMLRKSQSTNSIRQSTKIRTSPRKSRRRVRSPNLTPVQSMAFESPAPTNFPIPELPTPLQHGPASDYQWGSKSSRPANTSISSLHYGDETGLVDAIAATMVGEWMWKYIRKRKSFGVSESTEDFAQAGVDGVLDIPGIGTRHKRWVWLSPYEKTVMWDSKQPTSGTALLGKKGRKLIIESVVDVKDDSPLPRKSELESAHNRSILILTPSRALKFTATTAERHHFWMMALSFLAESNRLESQLPPLPLVPPLPRRAPPPPPAVATRQRTGSPFGRAAVRDSIRLAKGKQNEARNETHTLGDEGAEFPAIPRLYSGTSKHQRKRSNTSPRLTPVLSTVRSFSSTAVSTMQSQQYTRSNGSAGKTTTQPGSSYSGGRGSPDQPNFFEATGTVRMEAFVDPNIKNGVLYVPALPNAAQIRPRRRRGDSNLSTTTLDKRREGYVFDEDDMDPFKGF